MMFRAPNAYKKGGKLYQKCKLCATEYDLDADYSQSEPPFYLRTWIDEAKILSGKDKRLVERLSGPYLDTTCSKCLTKKMNVVDDFA